MLWKQDKQRTSLSDWIILFVLLSVLPFTVVHCLQSCLVCGLPQCTWMSSGQFGLLLCTDVNCRSGRELWGNIHHIPVTRIPKNTYHTLYAQSMHAYTFRDLEYYCTAWVLHYTCLSSLSSLTKAELEIHLHSSVYIAVAVELKHSLKSWLK